MTKFIDVTQGSAAWAGSEGQTSMFLTLIETTITKVPLFPSSASLLPHPASKNPFPASLGATASLNGTKDVRT